jgi:hypothetical protein
MQQQQQSQQQWDASLQDAVMQQQYYQQYDPSWQQYAQYDPSVQQQYAQQYDPSMQQHYAQQYAHQGDASYVQQYEQYQQRQSKLKLQTASKLGFSSAADEGPRYTATGRVQRKASKGIARLIAEEGGVPQDHSLAAPPPNARCVCVFVCLCVLGGTAACGTAGLAAAVALTRACLQADITCLSGKTWQRLAQQERCSMAVDGALPCPAQLWAFCLWQRLCCWLQHTPGAHIYAHALLQVCS